MISASARLVASRENESTAPITDLRAWASCSAPTRRTSRALPKARAPCGARSSREGLLARRNAAAVQNTRGVPIRPTDRSFVWSCRVTGRGRPCPQAWWRGQNARDLDEEHRGDRGDLSALSYVDSCRFHLTKLVRLADARLRSRSESRARRVRIRHARAFAREPVLDEKSRDHASPSKSLRRKIAW